ncbi:tripartite tricarboxylate transporter TctB family protein [Bradyrhizobium daqingense]|uniref:Tripartite tricarboxylate transporter TctB family protein n=1 Tax=Bradyrhizobium daqingense TaxID=993502 RepID=A0A562LTV2_9BRAD|nr:tripartite tricarboxylate transporter TctB family protein [Bradyrhizobium daqingense]TWI11032.1 tripartite tricarboxylate transporter TctB family protein [Bradyrhizobium daqingense]UFS92656.1 tripartite tricarboxylate transporter TctB family protein [Bradyrhizobium daqingense]
MTQRSGSASGPAHKTLEIGMALLIGVFGLVVIFGSLKAGINWGAEGPRAGFFPFYIGAAIVASSAINLWNAQRDDDGRLFAEWGQLRQVMSVVVPTAIYVGSMPFIGLYVASMVFIAWFMRWLGGYRWLTTIAIAVGMPVVTYLVFERWFLVPLPKGPIEDWLGL